MNASLRSVSAFSCAALLALAGLGGCSQNKADSKAAAQARPAEAQPADMPATPPAATAAAEAPAPAAKTPAGDGARARRSPVSGGATEKPKEAQNRPGLGTEWGESRTSQMTVTPFIRDDARTPWASASLFYNDAEGARAMSDGFRPANSSTFSTARNAVSIGLRGDDGRFFTGFSANERDLVVGEVGRRYTIVIRNLTDTRFETVVSVDGLDVIDGKQAGFAKRGYILDARGELEVDGFRQSAETVASFRFGSVRGSYAGRKHGDTRNVGVIGVALFNERGSHPNVTVAEVTQRKSANPFPGNFATPPR